MSNYIGIDTSNYTSSCAVYDSVNDEMISLKKLLPVAEGQIGLRQSDAVFHHTKNLPPLLSELCLQINGNVVAVSASYAPRDAEGSYMPCFSVGEGYAYVLSAAYRAKLCKFSHQAGHIAAALWSTGQTQLIERDFIAFHVSGGTTDVLYVRPDTDNVFSIEMIGSSLDLKAGQAVDRVGGMLNLGFPSGPALDDLAAASEKTFRVRPFFKDGCCSFSGVENKCRNMADSGEPATDIAKYCIDYICEAVRLMTKSAIEKKGNLPLIFAGGVMSNSIINKTLSEEFGAYFAPAKFSSDNAAGTAYLGFIKETRKW